MINRRTRRTLALLLVLLITLAFTGCDSAPDAGAPAEGESQNATGEADNPRDTTQNSGDAVRQGGGYKFAFAVKNQTNPLFIAMAEGMQEYCDSIGATLQVQATESETEIDRQMQMLETFLTQDFDAIFVTPLSSTAIVPFIKDCNDMGVPVICVDTIADADECEKIGAAVDIFVTADNRNAGELAARTMVDVLDGSGKIAILEGTPGTSTGTEIDAGMHAVLDGTGIVVAASQTAEWNRNLGYDVAQTILTANPDLDGILAANDEMALGAIRALKDSGLEMIPVIGINAVPDALESVRIGDLYATVDKQPAMQGITAIQNAVKLLEEESFAPENIMECALITADDL